MHDPSSLHVKQGVLLSENTVVASNTTSKVVPWALYHRHYLRCVILSNRRDTMR